MLPALRLPGVAHPCCAPMGVLSSLSDSFVKDHLTEFMWRFSCCRIRSPTSMSKAQFADKVETCLCCIYASIYKCVYPYIYIYTYTYIYKHTSVCVCIVCIQHIHVTCTCYNMILNPYSTNLWAQSFTVKVFLRYAVNAVTAVHIMMISSVLSFAIACSHCFRDHCCHYRHYAYYCIHSSSPKSYYHKTLLWLTYFLIYYNDCYDRQVLCRI